MTVEDYLRSEIPGYPFKECDLKRAVLSPIFAKPVKLRALSLDDSVEDNAEDEEFVKSLTYATSTLYYSAAGAFSGGSLSEQVGDIRASVSGIIITQRYRDYFRTMGDKFRKQIGADVEETSTDSGGMRDGSYLIKRTPNCRRAWS